MKNRKALLIVIVAGFLALSTFHACKKKDDPTGIDKQLYDLATETAGFVWYKHSDSLLARSAGSGHSEPFLRTRFNATAATMLDSIGKVTPGSTFPDGSLVVKELFDDLTTLGRYAILYKQPTDDNADANGWVWGYLNANGSVVTSASDKGSGCIGCHSQANNIDYMLMNVYFP